MATKCASRADSKLPSCSAAASKLLFRLSVSELLAVAAEALAECAESNDEAASRDVKGKSTRFHAKIPPPIAAEAYLKRLLQLTPYPLDALILSLVYINRITHLAAAQSESTQARPLFPACHPFGPLHTARKEEDPAPILNNHTLHRLLLGSLVVAAAYTSDHFIARNRAVKVGGTTAKELHELELEVFTKLDFNCVMRSRELEDVCRALWERTSLGQEELEEAKRTRFELDQGLEDADEEMDSRTQYCYTPKVQMHHKGGLASSPRAPQRVSFAVPDEATPPLSEGESESSYFSSSSLASIEDCDDMEVSTGKESRNSTPRLGRGMMTFAY